MVRQGTANPLYPGSIPGSALQLIKPICKIRYNSLKNQSGFVPLDEVYKYKFLERLEAAKIEREKAFYHSSVSNLYFAVFNYMQGIIGEPPQGRWKHGSITKPFAKVCYEKGIYNTTTLREFINRYENSTDIEFTPTIKDIYLQIWRKQKLKKYLISF